MNHKKPVFWLIFITIAGVVGISISLLRNAAMIELPDKDAVQSLELEWMNQALPQQKVTFTDKEQIHGTLKELAGGIKTMRWSVHDYPYQENVLILRWNLENERRTFCLYEEAGSFYLEEPYMAIYRVNRKTHAALLRLYEQGGSKTGIPQ